MDARPVTGAPDRIELPRRPFTALERDVGIVAFGAFKIGRVDPEKYERPYELPSDVACARLLEGVLDLGIDLIDTAPAYGLSESRIGAALSHRREAFVISTKAGETRDEGVSVFDYSDRAIEASVCRSLVRLRVPMIDVVFIHSDGNDLDILGSSPAVEALDRLRRHGLLRAVGFSGKTVDGGLAAVDDPRIDAVMVVYNPKDTSQLPVIEAAGRLGKAVLVKKPLAQGRFTPAASLPFILERPEVTSVVIGSLDLEHMAEACRIAAAAAT